MSTITKTKPGAKRTQGKAAPTKRVKPFVSLDAMLTVDDWLALPDTKPRYELINGKLVQKMTTTSNHSWAVSHFLHACLSWGMETGWKFFVEGMGYRADLSNGFVPDIAGFSPKQTVASGVVQMPTPFIAVEVLSPGTAKLDRTHKHDFYAQGGVRMYVLVDTSNRTIEVYRLNETTMHYDKPEILGQKDIWQPADLPGLKIELKNLWLN